MVGRKPKPTAIRLVEGNREHRPINKAEPKPAPVAPRRPAWLSREGKRIWREQAPKLERLGILTELDGDAFAAYCECYAQFIRACRVVKDNELSSEVGDKGYLQTLPEIAIAQKYLDKARAFMGEFGLTPAARARLAIKASEEDEFEGFLN